MNQPVLKTIAMHLHVQGLSPSLPNEQESILTFNLSQNLLSELVLNQTDKKHLSLSMLTIIDTESSEDLEIFALALAPRVSPLKLATLNQQLCLQLNFHCTQKTLRSSLNEAIVMMRHMSGAIFTGALELQRKEKDLMAVLEQTIAQLAQPRLATQ
ncbi:hypothetical protein [Endozoicomonas numazuensis]|uniref:Uncharacterized protein n=1 Tax=Endozoicomonas numazuensis TaxID=1137799 RepID=A0A081NCN4_9GAMM|nr:hypothetical protein [Endozoicomonas numazuensis]KEQ16207.1 hypothetical protein GZ78_23535 [Endozoicomonas numazuensis]